MKGAGVLVLLVVAVLVFPAGAQPIYVPNQPCHAAAEFLLGDGPLCYVPTRRADDAKHIAGSPASRAGTLLCESHDVSLWGGCKQWESRRVPAGGPDASGAAAADGRVFVSGYECRPGDCRFLQASLVAYDAETGAELWSRGFTELDTNTATDVATDGSRVYVSGTACVARFCDTWVPYVTAFDAGTGAFQWVAHGASSSILARAAEVAVADGRVYLVGYDCLASACTDVDAFIATFDAATGAAGWSLHHDGPGGFTLATGVAADDGRMFLTTYGCADDACDALESEVRAYHGATGIFDWATDAGPGPFVATSATADAGTVFVGGIVCDASSCRSASAAYAHSMDAATGAPGWTTQFAISGGYYLGEAIASDAGEVFLAGDTCRPSVCALKDAFVVKLDGETGAEKWMARELAQHGNSIRKAAGVAVLDDAVFLAGDTCYSCGGGAIFTAAYDRYGLLD